MAQAQYYSEVRIERLYELLKLNIMPWMWDHDNYSGENKSMIGFFYEEDIENVRILKMMGL